MSVDQLLLRFFERLSHQLGIWPAGQYSMDSDCLRAMGYGDQVYFTIRLTRQPETVIRFTRLKATLSAESLLQLEKDLLELHATYVRLDLFDKGPFAFRSVER